jgi:DNA-directed RNA polymerase I subunit RPA43
MSALVNGAAAPTTPLNAHTPLKSKKRKPEGDLDRSSTKKHKHDKVKSVPELAAPAETEEQTEADSNAERKRRKEEKRRRKAEKAAREAEEDSEGQATNGNAPAEGGENETADGPVMADDATPVQLPSEKKRKKKRKGHENSETEDTSDKPLADESQAAATTQPVQNVDSGIDLPDAPPVIASSSSPPRDDAATIEDDSPIQPEEHTQIADLLSSTKSSPFYSVRLSLYLPIPAIGLIASNALPSAIAQHLSPLLLTYYRPANGIVLAFEDPILSAHDSGSGLDGPMRPPSDDTAAATTADSASHEVLARAADEFGVCWAWLTTTFLVFRPSPGEEMLGWTNVASEGFVGLVSYNMFQASVGKERIPEGWRWEGPETANHRKAPRKGKLGSPVKEDAPSQPNEAEGNEDETAVVASKVTKLRDEDDDKGHFLDTATNTRVSDTLTYKIADIDLVPGHAHGTLTYQIDASLLDAEAEKKVNAEAKARWERQMKQRTGGGDVVMSGGLGT